MELSRQEYPVILASLQPAQAISALNERLKRVGRVNTEIADWLLERRKVEESYVQGLKKLANKQPPDSQSELGVFTTPWKKIVAATESIAQSHHTFATRIEQDVELALREFSSKNQEMKAMATIQADLVTVAKELDDAQQKADKLGKKGGKANSLKVENATQKLETATSNWESRAPFVFERLQAVDESRLNHLRAALTQYQTHEADQVERCRVNAETTLNALLEVNVEQEIQNFSRNTTQGHPKLERTARRASSSAGSNTVPPLAAPRMPSEDEASQTSEKKEGLSEPRGGLRRLGTMLGRRRQSVHGSFGRASSPSNSKGYSPFGRAPGSRDGRPIPIPSPRTSSTNLRETLSRDNRLSSLAESPTLPTKNPLSPSERRQSREVTNGDFMGFKPGSLLNPEGPGKSPLNDNMNGTPSSSQEVSNLSDIQSPPGPTPKEGINSTSERDSEGFSVPSAHTDPISLAQAEAAAASNEADTPQFKLDIKKDPIREEDADAQAALSNVAKTLRSSTSATPSRKLGTVRGRRDGRNTMYVTGTESLEVRGLDNNLTSINIPPSPGLPTQAMSLGAHRAAALATLSTEHSTASVSDTQSIKSQRSLGGNTLTKHPDMHESGLNCSIIETVSVSFENGILKSGAMVGEVALSYVNIESNRNSLPSAETIKLNNFHELEGLVPNHAFIHELAHDRPGEYSVNVSQIAKTTVALRYKVPLSHSNQNTHVPLLLKPAWRSQGEKLGVVIEYALNPGFAAGVESVTLANLVLIATYEGAKAAGCQTKPTGTHLKEKSLVYWRLGDVTLTADPAGAMQKVVGRLIGAEGGEPHPGIVEARWEIVSSLGGPMVGSGLSISNLDTMSGGKGKDKADSSDPFADDLIANQVAAVLAGGESSIDGTGSWAEVKSVRRLVSGKYDAKQIVVAGASEGIWG